MKQTDRVTDELLVLSSQQGNTRALTELIGRWRDRLWRLAWRLTDDEQAAWDVVQEAWIVIARRVGRLEDPAAFPAWAYRITSNKARDWVRRRSRVRRVDEEYAARTSERRPGPSGLGEDLREALAALPGRDRAILSLRYEDNFTTAEIAEILSVPAGTVKSRLHNARGRLRRFLLEDER